MECFENYLWDWFYKVLSVQKIFINLKNGFIILYNKIVRGAYSALRLIDAIKYVRYNQMLYFSFYVGK